MCVRLFVYSFCIHIELNKKMDRKNPYLALRISGAGETSARPKGKNGDERLE